MNDGGPQVVNHDGLRHAAESTEGVSQTPNEVLRALLPDHYAAAFARVTALIAMLGLLLVVLSTGVGTETTRSFAVVIIGGPVMDTSLTIFLLPLLYPRQELEFVV